jgi:hypothetical protein
MAPAAALGLRHLCPLGADLDLGLLTRIVEGLRYG